MNELHKGLPPLPARILSLPIDSRGFPVPWFVRWEDDEPDFRVIGPGKVAFAVKCHVCWICGEPLGKFLAFVIGPLGAINRINSEPPSHFDCADFAARACPFLSKPRMRRNEVDLPEGKEIPGIGVLRNPGVACVWVTRNYKLIRVDNGALFELGEPERVLWYCEGRVATRAEVKASIDSEKDGPEAITELGKCVGRMAPLLPAEEAHAEA